MTNSGDFQDASTDYGPLTPRQAENVADLAARRAQERLYAEVGRNVISKTLFWIGTGVIALGAWLSGWIHVGPPK